MPTTVSQCSRSSTDLQLSFPNPERVRHYDDSGSGQKPRPRFHTRQDAVRQRMTFIDGSLPIKLCQYRRVYQFRDPLHKCPDGVGTVPARNEDPAFHELLLTQCHGKRLNLQS